VDPKPCVDQTPIDTIDTIDTDTLVGFRELDDGGRLQLLGVALYGRNRSGTPYYRRHLSLELQVGRCTSWEVLVVADSVVQLGWSVLLVAATELND
jgi:hypothetical protein